MSFSIILVLRIVLFSSLLILPFNTFSQARVGIKAGINHSSTTEFKNFKSNARITPMFGVFTDIPVSDGFHIQPEFLYSAQGTNYNFTTRTNNQPASGTSTLRANYLNVPILAKIYLGEMFNLLLGPQFGLLMSAREGENQRTFSNSGRAELRNSDFSLTAGIGIDLPDNISIGARYNHGFSDISARKNYGISNRVFQFHIGYMF